MGGKKAKSNKVDRLRLIPIGLLLGTTLCLAAGSLPVGAAAAEEPIPLQALVDGASDGSVLRLPEGRYAGPAVINKAVRLQGEGRVTVVNGDAGPVIRLEASGAELSGIAIEDSRDDPDSVALEVAGSSNLLKDLAIITHGFGIRLNQAHDNRLESISIEGQAPEENGLSQDEEPVERGNGIDLLESNGNRIRNNKISNMFDGVYIEKGSSNRIEDNMVTHSRYGYHLMFSRDTVVTGNTGSRNVTGAMIMADEGARVTDNDFAKQSANATAQGILLFDVKRVLVENNRVEGNRLGIYAQTLRDTTIKDNRFVRNFVGIQMTDAEGNRLTGNDFVANVIQAQAVAEAGNVIEHNFWDDNSGLDLQGDGISDLPYRSNSFFLTLTDETPAYQLFFGAPGMLFLEGLFGSGSGEDLKDQAPFMKPHAADTSDTQSGPGWAAILCGGLLLAASTIIFVRGGRT
jgi:nitrous oxidase accessory protein